MRRLTLRTLMILVAVVSLGLGAKALQRRSAYLQNLARVHEEQARFYRSHADLWGRHQDGGCMELPLGASGKDDDAGAARCRRQAAYHAKLGEKYAYAASHPWIRIQPEPPGFRGED
jgi:hypothetical protein